MRFGRCAIYIVVMMVVVRILYFALVSADVRLPANQENVPLTLTGEIVSIPQVDHQQARFRFQVHHPDRLLQLNWQTAPLGLRVGDQWRLNVILKRIHGVHNPGSFDYERWAREQGLFASGRVMNRLPNKRLAHHWYIHPVHQLRQAMMDNLKLALPGSSMAHWLIALVMGERAGVPQSQWEVLRHTGTNHLMAIGGLHIGMVAGFIYFLVNQCWRRLPTWMLVIPAQEAATVAAWMMAWVYGALSGFAIPAQRACLMLTVFSMAVLSRRKINPWYGLVVAMLVVLLVNPLSFLSDSFWLSFGTIALIIFGMGGRYVPPVSVRGMTRFQKTSHIWWKWGRVQWVIGLGLMPLSLALFQACSLSSFLANTIAIPWLGCLVLPFCLLGSLLLFIVPVMGRLLLQFADVSLFGLWCVLEWLSQISWATWSQAMPGPLIFVLSLGGILMLISPAKFPARWFGVIWLLPVLLFKPPLLPEGVAKVTLLDVGQGLAVVVQTRHHVLVFDAGPPTPSVVVPFLRTEYVKQIDRLVISHGDMDHIGGAKDILRDMPVRQVLTSVPEKFPAGLAELCLAGQQWQWEGVTFRFLYPYFDTLHLGNDSSCVLRVDAGRDSVLIPGDIEQSAENVLLERTPEWLHVTALIAPHHGSHTSGAPAFIQAVYPRYVLYATGYLNRYHFPHQDIVDSYGAIHSEAFDTAKEGAVQWVMGSVMKSMRYVVAPGRTIN